MLYKGKDNVMHLPAVIYLTLLPGSIKNSIVILSCILEPTLNVPMKTHVNCHENVAPHQVLHKKGKHENRILNA